MSELTTNLFLGSDNNQLSDARNRGYRGALAKGFLIGILVKEAANDRQQQNLDIEDERPMFDVIQVMLNSFIYRGVAPPAAHLGPAGYASRDLVTQHVPGNSVTELVDVDRSLWSGAHQGHIAPNHIEELRQLVETHRPKKFPHRSNPLIIRTGPAGPLRLGIQLHRAELVDVKSGAIKTDPFLFIKDWPP